MVDKSRKNLTRFTYETTSFQGWRLCVSKFGETFTKYFSDKKYENEDKALAAAEEALVKVKEALTGAKKVKGKLSVTLSKQVQKILKAY